MEELRASIEAARQEARDAAAAIEENEALLEGGRGELEAAKEAVREAKAEVAAEKERLNKQNKEMHQMGQRKDKLAKDQSDRELEMKKLKHATDKIRVSLKFLFKSVQTYLKSEQRGQRYESGGGGTGAAPFPTPNL